MRGREAMVLHSSDLLCETICRSKFAGEMAMSLRMVGAGHWLVVTSMVLWEVLRSVIESYCVEFDLL